MQAGVTKVYAISISVALTLYCATEIWILKPALDLRIRANYCGAGICSQQIPNIWLREPDSSRGVRAAQTALLGDLASPYRWADLAELLAVAHRQDEADYCFQRAILSAPHNPAILMRVADGDSKTGRIQKATASLRFILRDPQFQEFYPSVFELFGRMNIPAQQILQEEPRDNSQVPQLLLEFLMRKKLVKDADSVWRWIVCKKINSPKLTAEYLRFLIRNNEQQKAIEVRNSLATYGLSGQSSCSDPGSLKPRE